MTGIRTIAFRVGRHMLTAVNTVAPSQQAHSKDKRFADHEEPPMSLTDVPGQPERAHLATAHLTVVSAGLQL